MGKWILAGIVTIACVFGLYLLVSQLPPRQEAAEPSASIAVPAQPADAAGAAQVYKSNCLSCHGDQRQGGLGPSLAEVGTSMTPEQIYKQIKNGGGGMPGFGKRLTEEQLTNLTNWLADMKG
ncbi:c-type cytochrome [Cohnella nanjingensis]|uniref:Cytochrome c n=1 Tax=Cohnella nanjingensis TaxID=1387779 RepID=A0A7X0RWE9_9BACL|nr:cytochrome c [Cohnella nanjingensis]MBB6673605.1 cytochrome c [Cohnella nanjingensis]